MSVESKNVRIARLEEQIKAAATALKLQAEKDELRSEAQEARVGVKIQEVRLEYNNKVLNLRTLVMAAAALLLTVFGWYVNSHSSN